MKKINYLIIVVATVILSWGIPSLYGLMTEKSVHYPFTYYSSILHQFCSMELTGDSLVYKDESGHHYTETEFDSLLPMFYYRQLLTDGRMPDSINGTPVNGKIIQQNTFFFRYNPSDVKKPGIKLFPLYESMSGRVDLDMPGDVFRLDSVITFIDPETNTVNTSKSNLFTKTLKAKGYQGPAKHIAGTPTTRKAYDEGYFIIDNNNKVFHMKMVNGKPFIRNTNLPARLIPRIIITTEYPNREFYGFLIDTNNKVYTIGTDNYTLKPVPTGLFNADKDRLMIMGNMFFWNVEVTNAQGNHLFAINTKTRDVESETSMKRPFPPADEMILSYTPFTLSFTSMSDDFIKPRFTPGHLSALFTCLIMALIYFGISLKRKTKDKIILVIWILLTGLYGFIPALIYSEKKQNN
ncbi:DUF4857 domain-containing protein [Marinilabiliaceae bacterium JC017]|nr:DUF4857 domain-containing protein [Marinilabiliaceae bacterium JC017]